MNAIAPPAAPFSPEFLSKNDCLDIDILSRGCARNQISFDRNTVHGDFHVRTGFVLRIPHFDVIKRPAKGSVHGISVPFGGNARGDPEPVDFRADPQQIFGGGAVDPGGASREMGERGLPAGGAGGTATEISIIAVRKKMSKRL